MNTSTERNRLIKAALDELPPPERTVIMAQARKLADCLPARGDRRQSIGVLGALELLYCISRWQRGEKP